jgi:hypothetical protein
MCCFSVYVYLQRVLNHVQVRSVYIESMGRTIANLFKAYHAQLAKLEMEVST